MDSRRIMSFLLQVASNNNRPWFQEHRQEYEAVRKDFEAGVADAIARLSSVDDSIAHVTVKDATYRFYRDTRFSADKSPYKHHFGAYINARGKKALRGGYYIHLEPGNSILAVGNYWLPTNILTACRNEIMANTGRWLECVESEAFRHYFTSESQGNPFVDHPEVTGNSGFGLEKLKTCPAGFPRDWEHVEYLRLKDYCAWHHVADDFFSSADWLDRMAEVFAAAKPMMDFMNEVIDDYE